MKRLFCVVSVFICCASLGGCWNYRGLNDIDIVTGTAVDIDPSTGNYHLTFEICDTKSGDEEGPSVIYVESEGETLFDAIRNSKKRLINKLYGGNMQTLIISEEIARSVGVSVILEELLRDGEPRETMSVVISQEETAKEILLTEGIDSNIISYQIHERIEEDSRVTASTVNMPLYGAYNAMKGSGNALVLPAVRCAQNVEDNIVEGNGIALFQGDRLDGFLDPEQTKFYLCVVNKIDGGVLSFPVGGGEERVSMEIKSAKTATDVTIDHGQLAVDVSIKVALNVMEIKSQLRLLQTPQREELERAAADYLQNAVGAFLADVQTQNKRDIFGLGRRIYQKDPELWRSLESDWDALFQRATIEVRAEATIRSSGVLKDY